MEKKDMKDYLLKVMSDLSTKDTTEILNVNRREETWGRDSELDRNLSLDGGGERGSICTETST